MYPTWNFSLAASESSSLPRGLKKMDGTESMDTMMSTSRVQPISSEMISILDKDGSSGNSTILRPSLVSWPVLSRAPG